ncbi:hypothetical protein BKG94_09675 [Rodentibacter ratti]|uniref:glycosyltransferase family 2 protein n=1 Tax=Rodentibacter ratti TaxID=1906745 RepID=UPI0009D3D493|nr:glycosyltransferase family 2 protein [Rodentibacter ratti]OOF86842.1 hypothetical protein BKG94_09675 [Rodentibacter ratti]
MNTPKISFILPVYNVSPYLSDAIKSILRQEISKEIILVDDGSTDDSLAISLDYAKEYPFIYVIHSLNKGVSAARNAGLRIAQGEFVLFLDPDDFLHPNLNLEKLYLLAKEHNVDVVKGTHLLNINEKYIPCSPVSAYVNNSNTYLSSLNNLFYTAIPNNWFIHIGTLLIKKEFLQLNNIVFNQSLPFGEDTLFNVELLLCSGTILEVADYFMIYRRRPDSAMTKPVEKSRLDSQYNLIQLLAKKLRAINEPNLQKLIQVVINMNCQHLLKTIEQMKSTDGVYDYLLTNEVKHNAAQSPISFA